MSEGHHFDVSSAAASEIVGLLGGDYPPAERFGRILYLILAATREVERRAREDATSPSVN